MIDWGAVGYILLVFFWLLVVPFIAFKVLGWWGVGLWLLVNVGIGIGFAILIQKLGQG